MFTRSVQSYRINIAKVLHMTKTMTMTEKIRYIPPPLGPLHLHWFLLLSSKTLAYLLLKMTASTILSELLVIEISHVFQGPTTKKHQGCRAPQNSHFFSQ